MLHPGRFHVIVMKERRQAGAGTRPYIFKPFTLATLKGALEDAALRRTPSDH
jgi:hypothetical protein